MMQETLTVTGLMKSYSDFTLRDISFGVPQGKIVGLIGENGAGKSTTIKSILGLVEKSAGTVAMPGKQNMEIDNEVRNKIGVIFDGSNFPEGLSPEKLNDNSNR